MKPTLNLGCGEDYHPDAHNVDNQPAVKCDERVDLADYPWPWDDETFDAIRAFHVLEHLDDVEAALRECARMLRPSGVLITRWPIGADAIADPDHEHVWTWRTPEFYCGKRHWDTDVGLTVSSRSVTLWPAGQEDRLLSLWDKARIRIRMAMQGPGPWCFVASGVSGEFVVTFRKP